ncbi:hypothetical protein E5D57_009818 [Metarhizium anisopliae]|nr:hypothetical protein E5D57_009818 [Metarhizium anisopliae]
MAQSTRATRANSLLHLHPLSRPVQNEPAVGANGPSIVSGRASLIVLDDVAVPPDRELLAVAVMFEPLHLPKQPMRSEELGSNSKLQNSKLAARPRATTTLKRTPSHRV